MNVKIINLNMRLGGKYTWDNIVAYIHEEQPDILLLQEVYNSTKDNVPIYLSTYKSLQQEFNFPYSEYVPQFNIKYDEDYGPLGLAIFSKFPLSEKSVAWLQGTGIVEVSNDETSISSFPRNLLHCQTQINNATYNLITLQGVWAPDGEETEAQKQMGRKIFQYISNLNNVIMAGDFNVNENTETVHLLEQKLTNVFKDERQTSFNMSRKTKPGFAEAVVDFVFTSPEIKVIDHYSSNKDVSDHQSQIVIVDV